MSRAVEFIHPGDFRKRDEVQVLEPVLGLIEGDDDASVGVVRAAGHHRRRRLLPVGVAHHEGVAKVVEQLTEKSGGGRDDQRNFKFSGILNFKKPLSILF